MFILTLWTWSRLRRQARPKTTGVAGTCKHEIIILVASVSAHLVNARVVEHFFLRCSSFERASRSLAKTGLFWVSLSSFFRVRFLFVFSEGLGVVFWRPWVAFGAILESFGSHFGDF